MAKYHGKRGRVYISSTHTGAPVSVCMLDSWSFDGTMDTVEVTTFCDNNKVYVVGMDDAKGSFTGYWDNAEDTLYVASELGDSVSMYLYPSADAVTKYWYGYAFITGLSIDTGVGDAVKVSADWVAAGEWDRL